MIFYTRTGLATTTTGKQVHLINTLKTVISQCEEYLSNYLINHDNAFETRNFIMSMTLK